MSRDVPNQRLVSQKRPDTSAVISVPPSIYQHLPIDPSTREIRVLKFVEPLDPQLANLVNCELEVVSLEDAAPNFRHFLSTLPPSTQSPQAAEAWYQAHKKRNLGLIFDSPLLSIPVWREEPPRADGRRLGELHNTRYSILPRLPRPRRDRPGHHQHTSEDSSAPALNPDETIGFQPRFVWGDFEAVSYCWESEVREKRIVVCSSTIDVPKNLEAALQQLRQLPEAKTGMKFWVDALCINQDDTHEKNHQVRLMRDIYSTAFSVVVWLGGWPESPSSAPNVRDYAIDFMTHISSIQDEQSRLRDEGNAGWGDEKHIWTLWERGTYDKWFSSVPWHALIDFLNQAYWHRLWIIQELVLNHNMTLFLYGKRQMTRKLISNTSKFMEEYAGRIHRSTNVSDWPNYVSSLFWAANHVQILLSMESTMEVLAPVEISQTTNRILDIGQRAKSKDPRDKVYGLLGLLPMSLAVRISPDYSLSMADVYVQMSIAMLDESGRLESILSWCSLAPDSSLPSWVPDWSTKFPRNHVRWLQNRSASGKKSASRWRFLSNDCRLICSGLIVDSVGTNLGDQERLNRYGDKKKISDALQRTLLVDHPMQEPVSPPLPRIGENICRSKTTLISNIFWCDPCGIAAETYMHNVHFWHCMQPITRNSHWQSFNEFLIKSNHDILIFGYHLKDFFADPSQYFAPGDHSALSISYTMNSGDRQDLRELTDNEAKNMSLASISCEGRKLVTTKSGYLGLAPSAAAVGDVVAIIYGCNFPVLLRPAGEENYTVVGECYVDGLMDGEAVEALNRGEYENREISLI
jgi:hypothetical protein